MVFSDDEDSEDDSHLFNAGLNKSSSTRKQDKSRARDLDFLSKAVESGEKKLELTSKLNQMLASEKYNADEQLQRAQESIESAAKNKRSRSQARDSMNGMMDDDEDGENEHDGLDRKMRMGRSKAAETGQSTLLGTTRTLFPEKRQTGKDDNAPFQSEVQALKALDMILKQKRNKENRQVLDSLQQAKQMKMLFRFLDQACLVKIARKNQLSTLPKDVMQWLLCVACSTQTLDSTPGLQELSRGAHVTLTQLWEIPPDQDGNEEPMFALSDMIGQLETWFGLSLEKTQGDNDDSAETMENAEQAMELGLSHWLELWGIFLRNQLVSVQEQRPSETSTLCIVALVRAGLDPIFHSGLGLMKQLLRTLYYLVDASTNDCTEKERLQWMETTVESVLDSCQSLGQGKTSTTEDVDVDKKGYLCTSLMARLFPLCSADGEFDKSCLELKTMLAVAALKQCLGVKDWQGFVTRTMTEKKEFSFVPNQASATTLQWNAFASALASFVAIDQDEDIFMNGPRCLAAVETMRCTFATGMLLYSQMEPSDEESGGIYGCKEEADKVARLLDTMESQASSLGLRVGRLAASRPLCGRAEYHLTCLKGYCRHLKDKATRLAGNKSTKRVQSNLESWYMTGGNDGDMSDEKSDDGGDENSEPMDED